MLLALAGGITYREIARSMKTSTPTVARWKMRFEREGMAGLQGRHRGSQPRAATPAVQARVIRRVQPKPGDGSTHWSCRKLANELGLSKSTVQRILVQAQLKPHRLERSLASDDPDFETKAAGGLYLDPPQHAVVCSAWMKRLRFRLWIGWIRFYLCLRVGGNDGFEYYRHGHAIALCCVECENEPSGGQDGEATPARSSLPF